MPSLSSTLRSAVRPPCIVQSFLNLCSQGSLSEALDSLHLAARKGIRLPSKALALLISRCAAAKSLKHGKCVHLHLKLTGLKRPGTFLSNHLILMYFECGDEFNARKVFDKMSARNVYSWNGMLSGYAKLGDMGRARKLFDEMSMKDVVSWNTMVIGYAKSGNCSEALKLYRELRRSGIQLNEFSFAGVLTACVKLKELALSKQVHGQVLTAGYLSNVITSSSIVDGYSKCGQMGYARRLFDEMKVKDVLSWTTLVSGYAQLGNMDLAGEIFDRMPERNPISWTSLISGYARNGMGDKALQLFSRMMIDHPRPDQFTFSSCLCASASLSSLRHGKQIHGYLIRTNFRPNTIVLSSLIDMYSKCGSLGYALLIFHLANNKMDEILWNSMISALAYHGHGKSALEMFNDMFRSGLKPNRVTFVIVLSACSHCGLLHEGVELFKSMTRDHGVIPDQEHYACLIDLLGRAGLFDEVDKQLQKMPFEPDDRVWNALLGVCKIHGNLTLGRKAAEHLIESQPSSSAAYVFLSGVYATLGKWELVEKVRKLMHDRCVKKEKAISWVGNDDEVHSFTASDELHPLKEDIYSTVDQLTCQEEEDEES